MRILVTGGAGFIGQNFVRYLQARRPDHSIVNLDKLTYAADREFVEAPAAGPGYQFVQEDICRLEKVREIARGVDAIVNFAAETHVDRSILDPGSFIQTDVYGTFALLEVVRELGIRRFVQVSTDEVYGSTEGGAFSEASPLNPSNPYSASKAAGDLMAFAYWRTHRLPVLVTRSSNNFGPYQYPEKVIPLFITNALDDLPLPLYGDGRHVRDWLYVMDNCAAIDLVLHRGREGEVYNIGGGHELPNIELTRRVLALLGKPESLIRHVADRPGHDRRYALDCRKLHALGWRPTHAFDDALAETVRWYQDHEAWWRPRKAGAFQEYYRRQYGELA
ncbi:MAG: dTDP-glucose 4,6-dehydratase [Candidatus Rokubacteria bacterium]|nr:dTDP-glucose 4,6-dehydratase [Candidatus Rokubacteria bacterium]